MGLMWKLEIIFKKKKEWRVLKWQPTTRALLPPATLMPAWSDHVWWLLEVRQVKWYLIKICGWLTLSVSHTNTQTRLPGVASQGCGGGSEDRWVQREERWVKRGVRHVRLAVVGGGRTLPLFIKPRQIQLACGLPSNPINLLSCESTQQLLPISHFSWPLIRSAGDIQWGSLQLHHRRYSCSKPPHPWSDDSSFFFKSV